MVKERSDILINYILVFLVLAAVLISLYVLSLAYKSVSAFVVGEESFCFENRIDGNEKCRDSDRGISICLKGNIEYNNQKETDYCIDSYRLKEFYCDEEGINHQIIDCQYGCLANQGACRDR